MCLLNVRSLGDDTKTGKIRDLVENDIQDLDLAIFTETWLHPDNTSSHQIGDITPPGFSFHHRARNGRKGGGVRMLVKSILKSKVLSLTAFKFFEHMCLTFSASNLNIHLVIIYRSPPSKKNGLSPEMFYNEFSTFLEEITVSSGSLIISGDFNFHVDDIGNTLARKFLNLLDSFNLNQHVNRALTAQVTLWT